MGKNEQRMNNYDETRKLLVEYYSAENQQKILGIDENINVNHRLPHYRIIHPERARSENILKLTTSTPRTSPKSSIITRNSLTQSLFCRVARVQTHSHCSDSGVR